MTGQPGSSRFPELFQSALRDYEKTTNISLTKHPLAERLRDCHSIESITTFLQDQAREFGDFRGSERIMGSIKNTVSLLCMLSDTAVFRSAVYFSSPPVKVIHTGLAVLLVAAKGMHTSYDGLVDLLESIEQVLRPLDIYIQIPPTPAMDEILLKIVVELLSTLALMTKEITQGLPKTFVKKIFREKDAEAILRRLDRLSHDEARTTATEILKVVHGLVQDLSGKASDGSVQEALEILHQTASDMNKSKRDQLQKAVQSWLSPPDPWKNHHIAHASRHEATATWFVRGEIFTEWKSSGPSSLLWIHGKPGAGKSVFWYVNRFGMLTRETYGVGSSTIIEEIEALRKSGLASLGFFYHDFRDDQKKDHRGLLSSLLVQLCHQSDSYCNVLTEFYLEHGNGSQPPSDSALVRCLMDVLRFPGQAPVYLIVDALDECPSQYSFPSPREKVLQLVEGLIDSRLSGLRICVTSRPEIDIKVLLEPISFRSISLHDEGGQIEDIENYIKFAINKDPRNRRWKAEDKRLVIDVLTKNAGGMFRWVYCQVVYLRGCHPGRIRHALSQLPETLDETYERTLREINKADWELAHRLFQCVAVASRPLYVEELAEFLAFDFSAGPIANFHEGWRMEDPVDAVLSICSTLVAPVNIDGSSVIQFSHFSVKEFLTSARLAEADDKILRRYHISMTPAHTVVTQACLGILLHLDKTITRDNLKRYPLAEYAAWHWFEHARFENVSQITEDGIKQLFDPSKSHLGIWVWICDPRNPSMASERAERPSAPGGTPLHYAAVCGLHSIVNFLAIEHSRDVDSRGFNDKWTPLHVASSYGHVEVARVLIEQGADAAARDNGGSTPLHVASYCGHAEVACFLIKHGADITTRDEGGNTSLHLASRHGNLEVARILVEHGADVLAREKGGGTPLHVASIGGHLEVARLLIEHGADAADRTSNGVTPLHVATSYGRVLFARFLIEHGADVGVKPGDGQTPLHLASSFGYVELVRILAEHGADVTARDNDGESPLHTSSSRGNVEVARILVKHGADVTARADNGWTPLHSASSCGGVEMARFLVEHGADTTASNNQGWTPWDVAVEMGHSEVARFLAEHGAYATAQDGEEQAPLEVTADEENEETASTLVEQEADATSRANNGWTPLHVAAEQGNAEVVRILVEHGAKVTARDDDGWTPLHVATSCGSVEVLHILVEHGADVTTRANNGWSPLHVASSCGSVDATRFLIEHGADAAVQANDGRTALHMAVEVGNVEVVRILVEHGAQATTGQPARRGHFLYYLLVLCLFVEVYLQFM